MTRPTHRQTDTDMLVIQKILRSILEIEALKRNKPLFLSKLNGGGQLQKSETIGIDDILPKF